MIVYIFEPFRAPRRDKPLISWTPWFHEPLISWTPWFHEPPDFMNPLISWTPWFHEPPDFMTPVSFEHSQVSWITNTFNDLWSWCFAPPKGCETIIGGRRTALRASCYEPRYEAMWFVTCFAPWCRTPLRGVRQSSTFGRDVSRPFGPRNSHRPFGCSISSTLCVDDYIWFMSNSGLRGPHRVMNPWSLKHSQVSRITNIKTKKKQKTKKSFFLFFCFFLHVFVIHEQFRASRTSQGYEPLIPQALSGVTNHKHKNEKKHRRFASWCRFATVTAQSMLRTTSRSNVVRNRRHEVPSAVRRCFVPRRGRNNQKNEKTFFIFDQRNIFSSSVSVIP
jgi:hypothetical protein